MNKRLLPAALACVVLLAGGCGTPSARIKRNPDLFATFPPEIQANIRQGKVDIGYTRDMVYMALGDPDRRYLRKSATGEAEVWAFTDSYTTTERQQVEGPFHVRGTDGTTRTIRDTMWVDVQQRQVYERLRIEFINGIVDAIETSER